MSTQRRTPGGPRTLADELRARSDEELAALLRARADLLSPLPGDLSQLATRAGTRLSVVRALERLDAFALQTAEALAVAPQPCPEPALAGLLRGGEEQLPAALGTLRRHALLWGGADGLRLVRTAQELLVPTAERPSATGLGPTLAEASACLPPSRMQELLAACGLSRTHDPVSAMAELTALFTDRRRMAALLEQAPGQARAALERLAWGPPYGTVGSPRPGAPLRWLLDRGLLLPTRPGSVVLPREVALHLRDGRAHRELRPGPPGLTPRRTATAAATEQAAQAADGAAAGQTLAATAVVEELLSAWESDPPPVLRAGGLGVRELKRTAVTLDVPEPEAAFWIELAFAAGLVAADAEADERYAPTPAYDAWLAADASERWARLAGAWLPGTRVPGLAGDRDGKGRVLAPLGPGLDRGPAAELRLYTLRLLADLPPGTAPEPESVQERVRWEWPRRMPEELRVRLCGAVLAEAELLGVTGRGALASFARPLLGDAGADADTAGAETGAERAARELRPALPEPVGHILLQADLTAVAPGPLERELGRTMALAADVESKGGATVYRFTPASVRRALDAGWTAEELHTFLAARSRTPVPQPLGYLVDDIARRHGQVRVGAASSYLRCDDEALLDQLLADNRAGALRLRRLAPTVLVSAAAPGVLLERLRELGHAPAAESAEGALLAPRGPARRTPPRTPPEPVPDGPPPAGGALLTAAVRALRAGDHAAGAAARSAAVRRLEPGGPMPRSSADDTRTALQEAADDGSLVRIGYVADDGTPGPRILEPARLEGGFVTAFDHTAEEVRTYPLHRITGATPLDDPPDA